MLKKGIFTLAVLFILTSLSYGQNSLNKVYVKDVRIADVSQAGNSVAVYLIVTNPGEEDAKLVGVTSAIAGKAALHTTKTDASGKKTMEVVDSITVPAGGRASLEPGGPHIMLEDIKIPLGEIDGIEIFLKFENARNAIITVPLKDLANEKNPFEN
ncbi:MAG: copper chaperone PCu(A)C [Candidatus Dadabacteria bacterium]|nr:copper chaperone PCu(A)C [Candidatus Dadabacteria bacterium]